MFMTINNCMYTFFLYEQRYSMFNVPQLKSKQPYQVLMPAKPGKAAESCVHSIQPTVHFQVVGN